MYCVLFLTCSLFIQIKKFLRAQQFLRELEAEDKLERLEGLRRSIPGRETCSRKTGRLGKRFGQRKVCVWRMECEHCVGVYGLEWKKCSNQESHAYKIYMHVKRNCCQCVCKTLTRTDLSSRYQFFTRLSHMVCVIMFRRRWMHYALGNIKDIFAIRMKGVKGKRDIQKSSMNRARFVEFDSSALYSYMKNDCSIELR